MPNTVKKADKPAKVKLPRVHDKTGFVAPDKSRLTVFLRTIRGSFVTFVEHKPAGDAAKKAGMFKGHESEAAARAEFARRCDDAKTDGWRERGALPESAFSELPKPGAALAFPKPAKKARKAS